MDDDDHMKKSMGCAILTLSFPLPIYTRLWTLTRRVSLILVDLVSTTFSIYS